MEQLGLNLPALIAQVINFGLLLLLLRVVAYRPILKLLDDRAYRIKESMERANQIKEEAARTEQEFAARRLEALRQGQEIVARANEAAERIHQEAQERARAAAEEFLAKSRAEIERDRQKAVAEIRSQMADLAILAASRLVRTSLDTKEHYRLVEEALAEAERAKLS